MDLEDSTVCYGQKKKLLVNMTICLVSVCLTQHRSFNPLQKNKKTDIFFYKEVLFFFLPSLHQPLYNTYTYFKLSFSLSCYVHASVTKVAYEYLQELM